MSAEHLSQRDNWQTETGYNATRNEKRTEKLLSETLETSQYKITKKPTIQVGNLKLKPELLIENLSNGNKLLIDDKLGENGGNAHERVYKYFTKKIERAGYIPLAVFSGKTFANPEPYNVWTKGKRVKVNPQKYKNEFRELLDEDQYIIMELDGSNRQQLVDLVKKLLS